MRNRHTIKSILAVSALSSIALTACNSGSGATSQPQTQTMPAATSNIEMGVDIDAIGILKFVGDQIANAAVQNYMQANGITAGNLALNTESYPILNSLYQATGNSTNEILAGLADLSNQLQQDTLLIQVTEQQYYQSLLTMQLNIASAQNQLAVDSLMNNVNGSYSTVVSWLNNINPNRIGPSMANIFQGLAAESAFSTNQVQAMLNNVSSFPFNTTTTDANDSLEDAGFALGMDSVDALYDWTQPIANSTEAQNVADSFFSQQLQIQEAQYKNNNPSGSANNFALYKQWSDSLDIMYAQVLNTLLQIGETDQIRVFLYANIPAKTGKAMPSIPSYIPTYHGSSLPNMESDVTYAMQYRIANLTMAIQQSKARVYNYYAGSVTSSTVSSSCGINEAAFLNVTESQVSTAIGSWNGSTLQTTCKENNGSTLNINYNVGTLCTLSTNENPLSTIGQGGYYTYPSMESATNSYNLYVMNGAISCGLQNWATTAFNSSNFTPAINTINALGSANTALVTRYEMQNMWEGILTWGDYLPIATPITNTNSQITVGGDSTANAYNLSGNYNQSILIQGLTTGYTSLSSVTGGMLVFDGVHAYMAVVYDNSNYTANIGIQCLPNDSTCSMGSTNGASYTLNFTNGDTLTIKNNGSTGHNPQSGSNPWYWITPNYAVLPSGYTSGA